MPAVSVIMVCHRATPFLRPAIASVLGQIFSDLELVLVDNGAGLTSADLGSEGDDARLRVVPLPVNAGIPAGHNAGLAAARGEFIALLDHDDIALPHRLERQVAALRADPRLGLVSSRAETIDEAGTVLGREFSLGETEAQRVWTGYAAPVVTPAYTGRREVFAALPYREELSVTADFDFLARAAERWRLEGVPAVLLRYRRHAAQATVARAAEIEQQRAAIRLLTARRRAGRPEDFSAVVAGLGAPRSPAATCRAWAERSLVEGFFPLAAWHARRAFVLGRNPAAFVPAIRAIGRARGAERALTARMFLLGPVRALALTPG